ncbi:hypothetical protein K3N28_14065 [Glycomyces sp. TRM65418]|uniref:hypothetical protein n=1 Tax=Glycomyces sp. TRM65418 TaxID=2867006 RepID=UPI001CE612CF|nr:hypothetical protein [Glycomyces sp. TRM65418]MCC3764190.1 hypothetical protein [Glycomyces sp. TRM65418]QZD53874.1 hypothetical protein K3N28_14000 [Glycomyces sp. TRM65418]
MRETPVTAQVSTAPARHRRGTITDRAAGSGLALTDGGRRWHRPLLVLGIACGVVALASLIAMPFDDRTLMGESVWAKAFKFGFSFFAYCLSLAWLLAHMTKLRRTGWVFGTVFAVISAAEVGVIVAAAAAGTYSHFNTAEDPFNQVVQLAFQFVPVMFLANLVIAVIVLFQRIGDKAVTAVVRWGLLLSSLGMFAAFFIVTVGGQGERTVVDAEGNEVVLNAGHGVGDLDGNGMVLTGWSTTGGDMRVPHFIGLHGIQVLIGVAMLLGVVAARRAWLRDVRVRAAIVHWLSLGYLGVFATTMVQAVRGQSFVAPDAATLAGFAASLLAAAAGIALTIRKARQAPDPDEAVAAEAASWEPAVPLR